MCRYIMKSFLNKLFKHAFNIMSTFLLRDLKASKLFSVQIRIIRIKNLFYIIKYHMHTNLLYIVNEIILN